MKLKLSDKDKKLFERNISLQYIIGSLMWGRFFIPVLALFYIASQVSLEQFAIIMAVFAFTTLILEIPTGVIADLLGKKKTLLLSRTMYIVEIAIIAFGNGFWPFLIAKVISGVGVSLSSGTGSALLYDSLKRLGREEEHKKISGKLATISNVSMAVVFIIGAYLFNIYYKLPAYVSLPLIILGFLLTFLVKEPYKPSKKLNFKNSMLHFKEGITYFFENSYLKYLAFLTLIIGSVTSMVMSLSSAYFDKILIPVSLIGVVSFFASLITAYSSRQAHKWESKLGERKSLMIIQILTLVALFTMSLIVPYWGLIFYFIIHLVSGFFGVLNGDYVNRHVESSHRATMISINNMFDNIGITIMFPILGILSNNYSMKIAFFSLGAFSLVYLIFVWFYRKNKAIK